MTGLSKLTENPVFQLKPTCSGPFLRKFEAELGKVFNTKYLEGSILYNFYICQFQCPVMKFEDLWTQRRKVQANTLKLWIQNKPNDFNNIQSYFDRDWGRIKTNVQHERYRLMFLLQLLFWPIWMFIHKFWWKWGIKVQVQKKQRGVDCRDIKADKT